MFFFTREPYQSDSHSSLKWRRWTFQTVRKIVQIRFHSGLFSESNFFEKMSEKGFVAYEISVNGYVESMENRKTKEKTKRDVQLFEEFLRKEKNDLREVHTIESAELNKYLAEFICFVRRKDGEDYEPSSLRCLVIV